MYHSPAVNPPTTAQLRSIAEKYHFNASDEVLEQHREHMIKLFGLYDQLEQMPEPGLPVKYLSSPGYKPKPENNKYNSWARITDTKGAPSGKLAGKSVAVKDSIAMSGVPMMNGSYFMSGYVPAYHASVVSRVLDAGAVIRGKAQNENLCFSGSSFTSAPAPVFNPFDIERSAGGTSSGNAVLVATGEVDLSIGTDAAGSIRIPASWCGIVGLKPTYGLVSYIGIAPSESTMEVTGPMAKTVKDCALLLEVMAGHDGGLDPRQPDNVSVPSYTEQLTGDVKGIRIALIEEGFKDCEPDVGDIVKQAARKLETAGATVEEISFPPHAYSLAPALITIIEGGCNNYNNGGITPLGSKGFKDTMLHDFLFNAAKAKADCLPVSVKYNLLAAGYIQEMHGCHFYAKAVNIMRDIADEYKKLFEKYDVLVMPTVKFKPPKLPKAGLTDGEYLGLNLPMAVNTIQYNATGHPALTINAGFSEGLPVGMMIVGRHFEETMIFNVAHAFEKIRDA